MSENNEVVISVIDQATAAINKLSVAFETLTVGENGTEAFVPTWDGVVGYPQQVVHLRCEYCRNEWHADKRGACASCGAPSA